jgi:hypothetical protein
MVEPNTSNVNANNISNLPDLRSGNKDTSNTDAGNACTVPDLLTSILNVEAILNLEILPCESNIPGYNTFVVPGLHNGRKDVRSRGISSASGKEV